MAWFTRKPEETQGTPKKVVIAEGLWIKCDSCKEIMARAEVERAGRVCPKCHYPFRISSRERIALLVDAGTFEEYQTGITSVDPLGFKDTKRYRDRLKAAKQKTTMEEAVVTGVARLGGHPVVLCVFEFGFLGGSMGSVVGEKLTRAIELAIDKHVPVIIVPASGGARMQEGILSLMQMAKTSAALARLGEAGLPYLSVLTDPDHRRRDRELRHAGRRHPGRAARPHRLRRTARDRGDDPPAAARGLPALGVPARARADRPHRRAPRAQGHPSPSPHLLRGPADAARMTYAEALARLLALRGGEHAGMRPGLERIEALLEALGHPEQSYTLAQVGGTNGKGSVAAMLAAMLKADGRRVGLYTSPHLVSFRERIRVNGEAIAEDAVVDGVEALGTLVARLDASVFEATTALALDHFARERVDVAVLEVGLGGRYDATTVGRPAVTVLTPIDLDHQEYLGNTVAEIAGDKAHIVRAGTAISAAQVPEAAAPIVEHAARAKVPLLVAGRDLTVTLRARSLDGQTVDCAGPDFRLDGSRPSVCSAPISRATPCWP